VRLEQGNDCAIHVKGKELPQFNIAPSSCEDHYSRGHGSGSLTAINQASFVNLLRTAVSAGAARLQENG
jgi:hypothetical protein